tara:strand:- start:80 stop:211 length:132 start_codon:yes stop_codon:yes gene_type:complete
MGEKYEPKMVEKKLFIIFDTTSVIGMHIDQKVDGSIDKLSFYN